MPNLKPKKSLWKFEMDSLDGRFWCKTSESGVVTSEFGGAICTNFEVRSWKSGVSHFERRWESGVVGKYDGAG